MRPYLTLTVIFITSSSKTIIHLLTFFWRWIVCPLITLSEWPLFLSFYLFSFVHYILWISTYGFLMTILSFVVIYVYPCYCLSIDLPFLIDHLLSSSLFSGTLFFFFKPLHCMSFGLRPPCSPVVSSKHF